MESPLIVELLDRRGRLKERHRVLDLPALVGRSYRCDVIVDDPFVSPEHLRLEREGDSCVAIDLESTNGTFAAGSQRRSRVVIAPDLRLHIGETVVRFRQADHAVAETLPLLMAAPATGLPIALRAALAWFAVVILAVGSEYLKSYEELRAQALVGEFTSVTIVMLMWSGLWAISNRIVGQRFHYLEHFLNAASWGFLLALGQQLAGFIAFAFGIDKSIEVAAWLGQALVMTGMLYGHLRLCSHLSGGPLLATASGIAGTLTLLSALASLASYIEEPRWDYALRFRRELKPPVFRLIGSHNVDTFFASDRELKEKVDKLAAEKK